jgi:hypothetical protein
MSRNVCSALSHRSSPRRAQRHRRLSRHPAARARRADRRRGSREVAASLAAALDEAGAPADACSIEQVAPRPLTGAPRDVLDALERATPASCACSRCRASWARGWRSSTVVERRRSATRTWSA